MLYSMTRLLISSPSSCFRFSSKFSPAITKGTHAIDQKEYIKCTMTKRGPAEWATIKQNILKYPGNVNEKNIDAVLLKMMVSAKNYEAGLSYAEYLKDSPNELSLGSINGLLVLYHKLSKTIDLSEDQKSFILQTHKDLYSKYKVLDFMTCERLLHALCSINEWKKALEVLDNITLSSTPSHSAYSSVIAALFKTNKKTEAMKFVHKSVSDNRPLQHIAYVAWIEYILRKYKDKKTMLKHLEEICNHIFNYSVLLTEKTAQLLLDTFRTLHWDANFTTIRKSDGLCTCCNNKLECLKVTDEEFVRLQNNIKEKLIVGSDLFLKTSPEELERFLEFVKDTAPYDIVLDALNIAYVSNRNGTIDKVGILKIVVDYFEKQNKKILLLGRKHMLKWPKKQMQHLMNKTSFFFTDDLSQDDPYFITAALLSGPNTDIVTKDLLRCHHFLLREDQLKLVFRRWQWQHQWMVFIAKNGKVLIQPPLKFTPCAQKKDGMLHLPFVKESETSLSVHVNDGTPNLSSWLCIRPKMLEK